MNIVLTLAGAEGVSAVTQEFHISITPVRDNEYLVRTEQVAPGVPLAEEQVIWPIDQWLDQTRQLMNDPLVGLLQGQRLLSQTDQPASSAEAINPGLHAITPTPSPDSESVSSFMELGQQLYQNLFQGILRDSWMTAQGIAQHRGEVLRLRLGLKGSQLPKLPWEVMHSHSRDGLGLATHPLATGINLLFSRYQPDRHMLRSGMAMTAATSSVLKILMVIALPVDQDDLDLDQEARHLQQELRLQPGHLQGNLVGNLPDIQVTILKHPSRTQLANTLEQSKYQVLHYAGHSDVGADGGKLYLVDQNGLTETVNGDDLAGLLVNNGIQMAVFNSCRGGHSAESAQPSERTLTDALVSRGIPAVLAMAERIPDDVALTLTRLFYRNLKQGYPVDLSLSRARQGLLSAYGSNQLYWALPTLYLHPDFDGYLTVGDRMLENPADSFARVPHGYTPSLIAPDPDVDPITASEPHPLITDHPGVDHLGDDSGYAESNSYAGGSEDVASYTFQNAVTNAMEFGDDWDGNPPNNTDARDPAFADTGDRDSINDFDDITPAYGDDEFLMSPDEMAELMSHATPSEASNAQALSPAQFESATSPSETAETDNRPQDIEVVNSLLEATSQQSPSVSPQNPGSASATAPHDAAIVHQPHGNPLGQQVDAADPQVSQPGAGAIVPLSNAQQGRTGEPGEQWRSPGGALQPVTPISTPRPAEIRSRSGKPRWFYPLSGAAAFMIAIVGYQAVNQIRLGQEPEPLALSTPEVVTNVGEYLSTGNLEKASEELDKVRKEDIGEPEVAFLRGQLIWELLKTDNSEFDLEDVRSYWEYAAQSAQDKPHYYNALGFALYSEGQMNKAIEAWLTALEILESEGIAVKTTTDDETTDPENGYAMVMPPETISNKDALTAYAGMALAFAQLAGETPNPAVSVNLVQKVVQIQQVIQQGNAATFTADALRRNWLWTDSAITEWELLSQLQMQ